MEVRVRLGRNGPYAHAIWNRVCDNCVHATLTGVGIFCDYFREVLDDGIEAMECPQFEDWRDWRRNV